MGIRCATTKLIRIHVRVKKDYNVAYVLVRAALSLTARQALRDEP